MLEHDINTWINNFINNTKEYPKLADKAYASLITSNEFVSNEDRNINKEGEKTLNEYIEKSNTLLPFKYGTVSQNSFNYIFTDKGKTMDANYRLYINCEHKNTSKLVYEILKQCSPQENLQLKYVSSERPNEINEKIVIYNSNEEDYKIMCNRISNTYDKNPELFNNNFNLPFMNSYLPGVSYGNQPKDPYVDLEGNQKDVSASFTSYIAKILLDSILDTSNKLAIKHEDVNSKLSQGGFNSDTLSYMNENYHKDIMKNMVEKVLLLAKYNKNNHMQNLNIKNKTTNKINNDNYNDFDI